MDDFDRDQPGRGDSNTRRRSRTNEPLRGDPDTRSRRPAYDTERENNEGALDRRTRSGRDPYDSPPRESRSTGRGGRSRDEGTPERYSDRFRRARDPLDEPYDDQSARATRDPYERLRRTTTRPARAIEPETYDESELDDYGDFDEEYDPEARPRRPVRRRPQRTSAQFAQTQFRSMGASLTNPAQELRPLVFGGLVALASMLLLVILVGIRSGSAPAWIPLGLDAEGTPVRYGTTSTIWRLPIFALFSTIMALGVGWWLRTREPFAVQFLAVGALMIHGIVWIGVITLLW